MASGPIGGGGGNSIDIFLRFLSDMEDFEGDLASANKALDELEKELQKSGDVGSDSYQSVTDAIKVTRGQLKDYIGDVKDTTKAELDRAKKVREAFGQISGAASRAVAISQGIFAGGAALTGGIFAVAQNYVKNAEEATLVTRAWVAETEALQRSGAKVGAVFAQEALPLLTKAAQVAEKAANFIEKHPEIIQAALKFGVAAATVGAISTAVTKGIKITADAAYIAATANVLLGGKLVNQGGDKMLAAAAGKGGLLGKALSGVGFAGLGVGALGTIAGFGLAGTAGAAGAQRGLRTQFGDDAARLFGTLTSILSAGIPGLHGLFRAGSDLERGFHELEPILNKFGIDVGGAGEKAKKGVSGTTSFGGGLSADVVDAYTQFREASIQAEKDFQSTRLGIIKDANLSAIAAWRGFRDSVKQINASFDKQILTITRDARETEIKAEQDYARQRSQVIRDAGIEIQRIEEDLQERLRQIALDSDARIEDLAFARDALGIIQERRRREQAEEEAVRAANIEIGRRRQDLALRLSDMAEEYNIERARRREEFEQKLKEAEEQRQEELKKAQEARDEELKRIRENKAQRLQELNAQYREELLRLREAFISKIRDLDASLLGEQTLRRNYYAQMLADAQQFLQDYRGALSGGASGGSSSGIGTITGSSGRSSTSTSTTTRAADQVISDRLTQQSAMMAVAAARTMTLNDSRRFSGEYTNSMRRAVRQDTIEILDNYLE
jgi:hypothetical protein